LSRRRSASVAERWSSSSANWASFPASPLSTWANSNSSARWLELIESTVSWRESDSPVSIRLASSTWARVDATNG
jgi:hypothetical protein